MGKGPIVLPGSMCFLFLGILSKWVGNPTSWGWGVLIFNILMGVGRAVYESTNKAIFVDFFPGEKSAGAFANISVFNSIASAIGFTLGAIEFDLPELYLLVIFAALTFPGFMLASMLRSGSEGVSSAGDIQLAKS